MTDEQLDRIISTILRIGVMTAALVVLVGGIWYLIYHGAGSPDYHVFRGEPADLRSLSGIVKDVLSFHTRGVIQFGLLLLIATPVARVAFSILAFALQKDSTYVLVTLIVFGILMYSLTARGL